MRVFDAISLVGATLDKIGSRLKMSTQEITQTLPTMQERNQCATVLIVEPDRVTRTAMQRFLTEKGYQIVEVTTGDEAIREMQADDIDLVLLSADVYDMDCFELLRRIRDFGNEMELSVIMMTRNLDSEHLVQALEEGANDYISKPINAAETLARIKTQLKLLLAQQRLRVSEERYSLAALGSNDGIWDWDLESDAVYYSPRWNEILGLGDGELQSVPNAWFDRIHPDDRPQVNVKMESHLSGATEHFECDMRLRTREGEYRWLSCRGLAVRSKDGKPRRFAGSLTDITESKVADPLTGLPNRISFNDRLQRCIEHRMRTPDRRFAVLYLDLDNFNMVNDGLGHDVGDQLLISVARRLENSVRMCEAVIARLGGDEFAILIEHLSTEITIDAIAQRIIECLKAPFAVGACREVFMSGTIGVSIASGRCKSPDDAIREADTAMYRAKENGKSCYEVFDPGMKERACARISLESMLRRAIERQEFELNYQPIVDISSGDVRGFEALIRWNHPEMGRVPPCDFIPIAEETGLIIPIGNWVMNTACTKLRQWNALFEPKSSQKKTPLFMGVNVSTRQFNENLLPMIQSAILESGASANQLKIEITESAIMQDTDEAAVILNELRAQGVSVAIDDFGTGYSSLAYLHRLPLDCLKVDQSFVNKMASTHENRTIVETIVTLAESLGLDVIAEGIETDQQRRILQTLNCTHGQGFLFSRPLAEEQVETLLQSSNSLLPQGG